MLLTVETEAKLWLSFQRFSRIPILEEFSALSFHLYEHFETVHFETWRFETWSFVNLSFCIPDVLKPDVLEPDVLKPDVLKSDFLWVYHIRSAI